MTLHLVPPTVTDRKTAVVERIKDIARPDGMLQCSRCGGRDTLTIRNGDRIVEGKLKAGTVVERGLCAHCWKRGILVDLFPPKPTAIKEPKPRRSKPKLVK